MRSAKKLLCLLLAAVLLLALGAPALAVGDVSARAPLAAFPDAESVSGYALEAMQWAVAAKVINGVASDGVNYLRPGENATRAQIATLLQNYLENVA